MRVRRRQEQSRSGQSRGARRRGAREGGSEGWSGRIAESVQVGAAQQRDRADVGTRGGPRPLNTLETRREGTGKRR